MAATISGATLVPNDRDRGEPSVWKHERTAECKPADHLGVVFVHGVGFQNQGETLLAWSDRLIRMLGAHHGAGPGAPDLVRRSEIDLDGDGLSAIELSVPAKDGRPAQHWLLTEAFWAAAFQPPSVSTMLAWLGARGAAGLAAGNFGAAKLLKNSVYLTGVVIGVLVLYSAIRVVTTVIPIAAVRNALIAPLDRLLTGWSGDMHVLLNDPAQSANIRARVRQSIRAVERADYGRVAIVAHSGGAVASYMTLTDISLWPSPAGGTPKKPAPPPVVSLVTLGQGLNIAWRLGDLGDPPRCDLADGSGRRLVVPLGNLHPGLEWHDFWSDGDQVADSQLVLPDCLQGTTSDENPIENKPSNAHGSYWDNDEEFVLPVVDRLERAAIQPAADGSQPVAETPAEFPEPSPHWQGERHLRVGMFSFTRRILFSAMALAILGGVALVGAAVDDLGRGVISVASRFPGHEIVTVPIGALHDVAAGDWLQVRHVVGQFGVSLLVILLGVYGPLRLGPKKLAWEYKPWSPILRAMIQAADVTIALVAVIPLGVWFRMAANSPDQVASGFWPFVAALALVAVVLLLVFLRFRRTDGGRQAPSTDWLVRVLRSGLGVMVLQVLVSAVLVATVLEVVGNHTFGSDGAPLGEVAIGAAAIWLLFNLLGRVANWRWDAWDERERDQFRRARGAEPPPSPVEPPPSREAPPPPRRSAGRVATAWLLRSLLGTWGRRVDLLVIGFIATAGLALAVGLGAPVGSADARWWLCGAAAGIVFIVWLIGSAQDAANSRHSAQSNEMAPLPDAAS